MAKRKSNKPESSKEHMTLTNRDLVKAVKNINKVMGIDPPISTKLDEDILKKKIIQALAFIDPTDKFTKTTESVFAVLSPLKDDPDWIIVDDEDVEDAVVDTGAVEDDVDDVKVKEEPVKPVKQEKKKAPKETPKKDVKKVVKKRAGKPPKKEEPTKETKKLEKEITKEIEKKPTPKKARKVRTKKDIFKNPTASTKIWMLVCENPEITYVQIKKELEKVDLYCADVTVVLRMEEMKKAMTILKLYKKLK